MILIEPKEEIENIREGVEVINIVNEVKIGSMVYAVKKTDKTIVLNGREWYGTIDYDMHEIDINTQIQDIQGQEQTLLHEIIHGIVKDRDISFGNDEEESIIDKIACGLHQLIKDNPKIFEDNVEKCGKNTRVIATIDGKVLKTVSE